MTTRDNGLHAGSYTPLTPLASGAADSVLESLRQAGVAAYVVGAGQDVVDRLVLWVDSRATARARDVLQSREPTTPPAASDASSQPAAGRDSRSRVPDEDAVWRSIVAAFDQPATDAVPRWPEAENIDQRPETTDETLGKGRVLRRVDPRSPHDGGAGVPPAEGGDADRFDDGVDHPAEGGGAGDADEHFVPPPPPPLPRPDPVTRWAWVGLLGGPLFLFLSALLGQQPADWVVLAALAAFVVGFVTLVARMKDRPPRDSGGDDGAVV